MGKQNGNQVAWLVRGLKASEANSVAWVEKAEVEQVFDDRHFAFDGGLYTWGYSAFESEDEALRRAFTIQEQLVLGPRGDREKHLLHWNALLKQVQPHWYTTEDWATDNFCYPEFTCPCGCGENKMSAWFVCQLQLARSIAQMPFRVRSGYRCEAYNAVVDRFRPNGMVSIPQGLGRSLWESGHMTGEAVDIRIDDAPHYSATSERFCLVSSLLAAGFRRIGIGARTNAGIVHVDVKEDAPQDSIFLHEAWYG